MSSSHLLWIGYAPETGTQLLKALEADSDKLSVEVIAEDREALGVLAKDPGKRLIVIIDGRSLGMDLASLVTGVKQINPAIEIIVLGFHGLAWKNLTLPRFYRPIILDPSSGPDVLISCVAKLREIVEAKKDYERLSQRLGDRIGMSRSSTEAVLASSPDRTAWE